MLDTQSSWNYASFNSPGQYNATVASQAYSAINSYAQSFVDVVRATGGNNTQRNIIVNTYAGCAGYGAHGGTGTYFTHLLDPLTQMNKPTGERNHLIFQVHIYPDISNLTTAKTRIDQMKGLWLIKKDGTKQVSNPSVAWGCDMSDVDIITGISDITTTPTRPAHEAIYNLHGQRITTPQKGIYIKNGKKLFLK